MNGPLPPPTYTDFTVVVCLVVVTLKTRGGKNGMEQREEKEKGGIGSPPPPWRQNTEKIPGITGFGHYTNYGVDTNSNH